MRFHKAILCGSRVMTIFAKVEIDFRGVCCVSPVCGKGGGV